MGSTWESKLASISMVVKQQRQAQEETGVMGLQENQMLAPMAILVIIALPLYNRLGSQMKTPLLESTTMEGNRTTTRLILGSFAGKDFQIWFLTILICLGRFPEDST